jgi:histidinol-phosphate aminotransferase
MPPIFRSELDSLKTYVPPKSWRMAAEGRADEYAKLTSNELAFGPLPEAEAALAEVLPRANRYPDSHVSRLREAIAGANAGVETKNVLVGNGSSEVLLNALQLLPSGGEIVYPWPSFSLYPMLCAVLGMTPRPVPLTEENGVPANIPADGILSAVTERTRAVILCNPNNPSGTYHPLSEVRRFAEALPENVLLVLDEAYYEFVDDPLYAGSHELVLERDNVVSTRTFSKVHGLAGFRVGYGLAPRRLADLIWSAHIPFSVNQAGQAAATTSLGQPGAIADRSHLMKRERERVQEAFGAAGLEYVPSHTNFVMVGAGPSVFEKTGVLVREGEALGYPVGWSRVTIGGPEENDRLLAAL